MIGNHQMGTTTMNTKLNKIKFKIAALASKTVANGCSEQEAISAMIGVGRLLSQYNLKMEECDVRESPCRTLYIDIGRVNRHPIDSCVVSLANLVGAKCWFHRERGKPSAYAFFGQANDLELLEYLFKVIRAAIENGAEEFKQTVAYRFDHPEAPPALRAAYGIGVKPAGKRKAATISFQRGMAIRLHQRLVKLKIENDAYLARMRPTGNALVALKSQLVEAEFKKSSPKLRANRSKWSMKDPVAYEHGFRAGDKVNLSRPLTGDGKANGGLLT
jgi:hypothetical protein